VSSSGLKARGPEAVSQQDPNRVVATIGGKQITAKQAMDLLKSIQPQDRKRYESNLGALLQQIYAENQIAGEATKMSLDQQSPWKEQLEIARANILTQAYLAKMSGENNGQSAEPKQYYDAHPNEFEQIKLSGILVAFSQPGTPAGSTVTRAEAEARQKADEVEKKIKAGGDFSALARTESDNQQSAAKGGDLGTFVIADPNVPADIKTAVGKLAPGQVSEPIRVQGGYYILKVDSKTKLTFEQVRPSLVQKMQNDKAQGLLKQELDKYKIQVQDPDFFNASNAPPIPSLQRPAPSSTPAPSAKP